MLSQSISAAQLPGASPNNPGSPSAAIESALAVLPGWHAIQETQLSKIDRLLREVVPANPFYARKFARCSLPRRFASVDEYARVVPATSRYELVRDRMENPPYGTNLTYPLQQNVLCHQTSGTTTLPIRWLDSL